MMSSDKLSIVVPVYGCPEALNELCDRLIDTVTNIGIEFEIVLVDDCCPKGSWNVIKKLVAEHPEIVAAKLSRNFGQHYAILCGLELSCGDWVVVMDCDLQDRPEEITKLLAATHEGYQVVQAERYERKDGFLKQQFSKLFYRLLSYLTETEQNPGVANFGIYSRQAIDQVIALKESVRFFPVNIRWIGYSRTTIPVLHSERAIGKSSYSFGKLLSLASSVILGFSDKPLRLVVQAGFFVSIAAIGYSTYLAAKWLIFGSIVEGWYSLMVSLWLIFGLTIFVIGIVGLYIARIFEDVKQRPLYIVEESLDQTSFFALDEPSS
ncbi:MAG: glycosyltransferase family 2 protein [Pseudomonadota bacterium]